MDGMAMNVLSIPDHAALNVQPTAVAALQTNVTSVEIPLTLLTLLTILIVNVMMTGMVIHVSSTVEPAMINALTALVHLLSTVSNV